MRNFYVSKRKLKKVLKKIEEVNPIGADVFREKYLNKHFAFISLSRADGFPVCITELEGTYCSSPICLHKYIGKRY